VPTFAVPKVVAMGRVDPVLALLALDLVADDGHYRKNPCECRASRYSTISLSEILYRFCIFLISFIISLETSFAGISLFAMGHPRIALPLPLLALLLLRQNLFSGFEH
jgi:hypothetical protein